MRKLFSLLAILLLLGFITACGKDTTSNSDKKTDKKLTIYTSIYPLQYLTEQIGGEKTEVKSVYPPGVDGHTYEPTTKEVSNIAKGDAFIYMGAGMEGFAESARETLKNQDVKFIEIAEGHKDIFRETDEDEHDHHDHGHEATHENDEHDHEHDGDDHKHDGHGHDHHDHDHDHDHDHGGVDPHIWFDPIRMIQVAEVIKDELTELNPEEKATYEKNYEQVKQNLTELDKKFTSTLKDKKDKHILVAHAAYGYWEERYGVEQIYVSGMFNDEPSQKDLTKIAETAKKHHIKYVIFEQTGADRVTEIIQKHIKADSLTIHNLEVRTEDDIQANLDYIDLMEQNLETLDKATK